MSNEHRPVWSRVANSRTWMTPPKLRKMPPWKVLLHNDDFHDTQFVVASIEQLTPLSRAAATQRMLEAHRSGTSMLLTTHQERAELYRDQFTSLGLTVTAEIDL